MDRDLKLARVPHDLEWARALLHPPSQGAWMVGVEAHPVMRWSAPWTLGHCSWLLGRREGLAWGASLAAGTTLGSGHPVAAAGLA